MRKARELLVRLALIGVGLGIALIVIEVGLRLFYPQRDCTQFVRFDDEIGWVLNPGYQGMCIALGHETVTDVKVNSLGLRNDEIVNPKPANTFRILILGDSMTFGIGARQDESFPKLLERELNTSLGSTGHIEVINAGVPAYGTGQELLLYRRIHSRVNPDLVILAYFVTNDMLDDLCVNWNPQRPCFKVQGDSLALASAPSRPSALAQINLRTELENLHTVVFFRTRLERLATTNVAVARLAKAVGAQKEGLPTSVSAWYEKRYSEPGWNLTTRLIGTLAQEVSHDGARFILLILPGRPQTADNYQELVRDMYGDIPEASEFLADPEKPQRLLANWATETRIQSVDVLPSIKQVSKTKIIHLQDGHFNAEGHRVITPFLTQWLLKEVLGRQSSNQMCPRITRMPRMENHN